MTRRMALALAVALTTVVTFGLVAMGRESGLFGDAGAGDDTLASAQQPPASATPDVEPDVTTEYIYLDESPAPQAPGASPLGISSDDEDDDAWEDDEREDEEEEDDEHHEDEHEDDHEDEHEHEHESEWDD